MDRQIKEAIERYDLEVEQLRLNLEFEEDEEDEDLDEWSESVGEMHIS